MRSPAEEIELRGHIIDSWTLPRVFDAIMDLGGDFEVLEMKVGKRKDEPSYTRLRVAASDSERLGAIVIRLQELGADVVGGRDAATLPAPADGVLPDAFYSTTNLVTEVRLDGRWTPVDGTEMDLAIVVDASAGRARTVPMGAVSRGDPIIVGHEGIRVVPPARGRDTDVFGFMQSAVSSEKPKKLVIAEIAREMRAIRERGGKILVVAGPAIVHSGAGHHLARLIHEGYVHVLFGGNAIAAHDVEAALHGTSLGVNLESGSPVEEGHRNHLRAINAIRRAGSIRAAVESGELTAGIMHAAVQREIEIVLAGSIRDDGPLPEVITDVMDAQARMRAAVQKVDLALLVATTLHAVATGNLLPASVRTVAVDINPAVVTKLADRGSRQAIGLVTDAELFLRELAASLDAGRTDRP